MTCACGALAIAVFGALLSGQEGLVHGPRTSLLIATVVAVLAGATAVLLRPANQARDNSFIEGMAP